MAKSHLYLSAFCIVLTLLFVLSCQTLQTEPQITSISAKSLGGDTVLTVPDSLLITFNQSKYELHIITRFFGCMPMPSAHCHWKDDTLLVLFKMNDQCIHDMAEYFEVSISVAPIDKTNFVLIVAPTYGDGWIYYSNEYHLIDSLILIDNLKSIN